MPKLSIIIPVYNVAPFLIRCLDSVCNQTLKDTEIICIDDCSTDNSLEILKQYEEKDNRIKVISLKNNCGAAIARNKGLEIAKGEYLGFIDPDDEIDLNYYETLYKKAKEEDFDIVKGARKIIELDGNISFSNLNKQINEKGLNFFLWEWFTAIYKASVIYENNIRFPDECRKAQDVAFLNRVVLKSKNIGIVDNVYYNYHKREGSLDSAKIPIEHIKSALLSFSLILDDLNNSNIFDKDKNLYLTLYLHRINSNFALTLFQNDTFESKLLCAQWLIDNFYKCKDTQLLEKNFQFTQLLSCIKNKNTKKLAEKLNKCKNKSDLIPLYKNPFQRIFSITKNLNKTHKIITVLGIKIQLKDNIKDKFNKKINKAIKNYKYIHIMKNDKFNKPFVDFLNRNFNKKEHMILCYRLANKNELQLFPVGENVYEYFDLKSIDFSCKNIQKIIFHSLLDPNYISFLYSNKNLLEKSYWMIWGNDLYNATRNCENDYVRANFKGYISDTDGDCEVAKAKYNSNPECYNSGYTFPITLQMLQDAKRINHDYIKIQLNNSADATTLEMLEILSKFKNENIKITTILSYGQMEYKKKIIAKGKEIFGDKFEYVDKLMSPKDFAKHLAQNDILILNQNRQQGLGNSFATLALGGKLFIKSEITTYSHFMNKGIKIFDTNSIPEMDFKEFIEYSDTIKENNIKNSLIFFDDKYLKNLWSKIFTDNTNINLHKYWQERAKKHGKRSVYNMKHPLNELEAVDYKQLSIYEEVLKKYLTGEEKTALDFGCGPGRFENMLAGFVKEKVYAFDITKELLDIAPETKKVEYHLFDGKNFDLPDNSVDLIFISLVLGGITNKDILKSTIEEISRVAKDNALFFIVENTTRGEGSSYWSFRTKKEYKALFNFVNLKLEKTYYDLGEEISIFVGHKVRDLICK